MFFLFLQVTQDLNKIKIYLKNTFVDIFVENFVVKIVCEVLAKNFEHYGSWSSSKFSIFQTKNLVSRKQLSLCLNIFIKFFLFFFFFDLFYSHTENNN